MSRELRGLKQVHLSRLSPVMWSVKHGYPRKAMTVPIESVGGMSGDDDGRYKSVPLDYQRQPVWNDLYRVGVLGAMSRVAPFGPAGFGGLGGPEDCTAGQIWNPAKEQCVEQCPPGYAWDATSRMCLMPGTSPPVPTPDPGTAHPRPTRWNPNKGAYRPYTDCDEGTHAVPSSDGRSWTCRSICDSGYTYRKFPRPGRCVSNIQTKTNQAWQRGWVTPGTPLGTEPAPVTGMSTRKWLLILGAIGLGVFLLGRRD